MRDKVLEKFQINIGRLADDPTYRSTKLQVFTESEFSNFGLVTNGIECLGYTEAQAMRLQRQLKQQNSAGCTCDVTSTGWGAGLVGGVVMAAFIGYLFKLICDMPYEFFNEQHGKSKTTFLFLCIISAVVDVTAMIVSGLKLQNRYKQNRQAYFANGYCNNSKVIEINRLVSLCRPFKSLATIGTLGASASAFEQIECLGKLIFGIKKTRGFYQQKMHATAKKTGARCYLLAGSASIDSDAINRLFTVFLQGIAGTVVQASAHVVQPTAPLWGQSTV